MTPRGHSLGVERYREVLRAHTYANTHTHTRIIDSVLHSMVNTGTAMRRVKSFTLAHRICTAMHRVKSLGASNTVFWYRCRRCAALDKNEIRHWIGGADEALRSVR
jgi:hypothetical protein